jgi:alpha-amylase
VKPRRNYFADLARGSLPCALLLCAIALSTALSSPRASPLPLPISLPISSAKTARKSHPKVPKAGAVLAPHFIYEIFTRSFSDSNGDGVGDLPGITEKLDYIQSLGADAIWLTPIFKSPSVHGYDVSDYLSIQDAFGSLADLKKLVASAHAKGIQVLLDLPVNHTSNLHPWFSDHSLYLWSPEPTFLPKQWYKKDSEYYFSSFSKTMPDLNWENPEVLTRIEAVFNHWTSIGIDGFRLDAAKFLIKGPNGEQNMPGTHALWQKIVADVRSLKPNTYFIGEIWDDANAIASYYGSGNELDAAFDFPVEGSIRSSIISETNTDLVNALTTQLATEPTSTFEAPFAGSHDLDRLSSVLGSNLASEKLAALIVFALPGTPVVYYGDEIGMLSGNAKQYPGDLAKRTPMDWATEASEDHDATSLLSTYRALAKLRLATPALDAGTLSHVSAIGSSALSFVRGSGATSALVILNLSTHAITNQTIAVSSTDASAGQAANALYGTLIAQWQSSSELLIKNLGPAQGAIVTFSSHSRRK